MPRAMGPARTGCGSGMARRSTDLLEVFNRKTPGPSAPRRRGSKGGGKRRTSGDVSGFFLGPRQILLACCVLLLLLVLSFVVGIGMGRRGDAPDLSNTQLRRDSTALPAGEAWYVRGRLAQVHQVRGDRIDPVEIPGALGMNPRHVHVEEAPAASTTCSSAPSQARWPPASTGRTRNSEAGAGRSPTPSRSRPTSTGRDSARKPDSARRKRGGSAVEARRKRGGSAARPAGRRTGRAIPARPRPLGPYCAARPGPGEQFRPAP